MDHRSLYKANTIQSRKRSTRIAEERCRKRNTRFMNGRNITESSISQSQDSSIHEAAIMKKISKQEVYLTRFLEWRANKKKEQQQKLQNKAKPFISAVKNTVSFNKYIRQENSSSSAKPVLLQTKEDNRKETNSSTNKGKDRNKNARVPLAPLNNINRVVTRSTTRQMNENKWEIQQNGHERQLLKNIKKLKSNTTSSKNICKENSLVNLDKVGNFATSTGRKSAIGNTQILLQEAFDDNISPVETCFSNNDYLLNSVQIGDKTPAPKKVSSSQKIKKKQLNTIAGSMTNISQINKIKDIELNRNLSIEVNQIEQNNTPSKQSEKPLNYVSPFVSILRGKVSASKEREKRQSIFKLNKESSTVRKTLEAVKYFRQILKDETDRLERLCRSWEEYKSANWGRINDGSDMIDVTIGQTKLLTTKKLRQFGELIDQCEDSVKSHTQNSRRETIFTEDLEGFWDMVKLQIQNVDKRFENLDQWKTNNWEDPENRNIKTKNKLPKVNKDKKKVRKPNSALKELLKKAQMAYKESQTNNTNVDNDVILMVPDQRRQLNSPRVRFREDSTRNGMSPQETENNGWKSTPLSFNIRKSTKLRVEQKQKCARKLQLNSNESKDLLKNEACKNSNELKKLNVLCF